MNTGALIDDIWFVIIIIIVKNVLMNDTEVNQHFTLFNIKIKISALMF